MTPTAGLLAAAAVVVGFVVGLLGGLLRLEVVVGAALVAEAAVGLLNRSVSVEGRVVGAALELGLSTVSFVELAVAERSMPGVGSSPIEAWLRDAGRSIMSLPLTANACKQDQTTLPKKQHEKAQGPNQQLAGGKIEETCLPAHLKKSV